MRLLIQRVKEAKVCVEGKVIGAIGKGLLVFVGVHKKDVPESTKWLVNKLVNLRIFEDKANKMNLSVKDVDGEILVVSQFTLYGNCTNGRRPDFIESAAGPVALQIYEKFVNEIKEEMGKVQTGEFAAHMQVSLVNDGPVTLIIDRHEETKETSLQALG